MSSELQAQRYPLIKIVDEMDPSLDSSQQTCSMGNENVKSDERCLCNLLHIRTGALIVAVLELIFISYQIISTVWFFDRKNDHYLFSIILILVCFILAFIAVILLMIGIKRKNPYLIVPHLLMQITVIISSFLLSCYLLLLLIGGTSVNVETIFYEDSPRGELGLQQSELHDPISLKILTRGLRNALLALLVFTLSFLSFQIWSFIVVRNCYRYFYRLILEKPLLNGSTDTKASKI